MCVCVTVCVLFLDLFQEDLRCLFRPHQVVTGSDRSLSSHSGQVVLITVTSSVSEDVILSVLCF